MAVTPIPLVLIAPPPFQTPFLDVGGRMTAPWQSWFSSVTGSGAYLLTVAAAGAGALVAANNLSDLLNAAAARLNLGLGTSATHAASDFDASGAAAAALAAAIAASDPAGAAAAVLASSLQQAANLSDLLSAATARTNLGLGTAATQPITAFDAAGAAAAAQAASDALGAAAAVLATSLQKAANLSDLLSAATARTNLGLGTAATQASSAFDAAGAATTAVAAIPTASATVRGLLASADWSTFNTGAALFYNVKSYGAKGDGATDDTVAITAAVNAANTAGRGCVFFPPGTYITGTIMLYNNVSFLGTAEESTILKLKAGTNSDLFQGSIQGYTNGVNGYTGATALVNITAAYGTGNNSGVSGFSIRNLTLDGNIANQTAYAAGIRVYGYGYRLENLYIRNFWGDGIYQDWNPNAPSYYLAPNQLESQLLNIKIHGIGLGAFSSVVNSTAMGIRWGGGTDSQWSNIIVYQTACHGVHIGPNGGSTQITQMHIWAVGGSGSSATCLLIDGSIYGANIECEGSGYTQCVILGPGTIYQGGVVFGGGTQTANSYGIQLGQLASDSTCPPWAGSYWQATPGNMSPASTDGVAVQAYLCNINTSVHDVFKAAFQFKNERWNLVRAIIWQTIRAYNTPASAPTLSTVNAGSLTGQGTLYCRYSYVTQYGETIASGESSMAVPNNYELVVTSPPAPTQVNGASSGGAPLLGYYVYLGSSSGAEKRQNSTPIAIGTAYTQTTAITTSGAAPNLSSNYSAAQVVFSGLPATSDSTDFNNTAVDASFALGSYSPNQIPGGSLSTLVFGDGTHASLEINNSQGSFAERAIQVFGNKWQIFQDWFGGTETARIDHLGCLYLNKSGIVLGSNTAAQSLATGNTITVYQPYVSGSSFPSNYTAFGAANTGSFHFGKIRVTASSAVTGLILQLGLVDGTETTVVNESGYTLTFAASGSNIAVASFVIAAGYAETFLYNLGTSLWHPT